MITVGNIKKTDKLNTSPKAAKSASGSSFASYLSQNISKPDQAVGGPSSISVADAIFSTQMVGSEEEREIKKKLIKRSSDLIDKLEEIRDGIIMGYISKDKLIEISRFVKEKRFETDDERLNTIIEEIELRVEVELAKLTRE